MVVNKNPQRSYFSADAGGTEVILTEDSIFFILEFHVQDVIILYAKIVNII